MQMWSQNTVITDDDSYSGNNSAVLDIYSKTKGLLAPRLTTAERQAITTPANGLLVYDQTESQFYVYALGAWTPLDAPSIWQTNNDSVYVTGSGKRYGVGTASPFAKLTVQGDATIAPDEPLFEVKNSAGDVIFAVYENEVKVNFKETAKGVKGGFAVGGLSGTKAEPIEYMRITPDSVRIYIDDTGAKGGFAVGGLNGTTGGNQYFKLDEESASIYLKEPAKGVKGGFAVGGLSGTKGIQDYLTIERDSARMYINQNLKEKGVKGGFAVGGLSGTKGVGNILDLTPENYFIGHYAGANNTTGQRNFFAGFESGMLNTTGDYNVAMGYRAGKGNIDGFYNVFIGYQAGLNSNTASNVFIGQAAGLSTVDGWSNVYIGQVAGRDNVSGIRNIMIGRDAGSSIEGSDNTLVGTFAGSDMLTGSSNVMVGIEANSNGTGGSNNVYLGGYAGYSNDGSSNVIIGRSAGPNAHSYSTQSDYNNSVMIGYRSGYNNLVGTGNLFLGYYSGYNETGSNKLYISNSSTNNLIYGEFDTKILKFDAHVGINTDPSSSYQLYVEENTTTSDNPAVYGVHDVTDGWGVALRGRAGYRAVWGEAVTASCSGYGIYGYATVTGTGTRYGVYGYASGGATAWAGYFSGNVEVTGTVTKSNSAIKIDHPNDPGNKYLQHANVASPDMKNIYDGVAILDASGRASIVLPDYFDEFNKDFRYQLTAIGKPAPSIYVEKEIENNIFVIAGGEPGMKISWQVTGIRKDPFAENNRLKVEKEKLPENKGKYMHPELYNKSEKDKIYYEEKLQKIDGKME
ncbi:MAG: hypothetical protein C0599_00015 [Salinivirgaceae bacterium]|nr:MAG: hypothetical protein C0599_00015 [Salinivirgaceae bacterium]